MMYNFYCSDKHLQMLCFLVSYNVNDYTFERVNSHEQDEKIHTGLVIQNICCE